MNIFDNFKQGDRFYHIWNFKIVEIFFEDSTKNGDYGIFIYNEDDTHIFVFHKDEFKNHCFESKDDVSVLLFVKLFKMIKNIDISSNVAESGKIKMVLKQLDDIIDVDV